MALDLARYEKDFFKLPGPAQQSRWVGEYEVVSVHTQGRVAKKLIKKRRPYEDKEINEYRIANYEPITKGPFRRFKTNLSRVFAASQVTIETGNERVQEYIDGNNFQGMSLRSFWSRKLAGRMIDDPNGFIVWWVDRAPETPNERVSPTCFLVLSKNVKHMTADVFTWLSNEKSMVNAPDPAGGGARLDQPLGDVYYIVTSTEYWKFQQVGRIEEMSFVMMPHYTHGIGYLPIDVLGGEEITEADEKTNEDVTWYTSFVSNAIPYANECARQWSDHQGVLIVSGFPLREMKPIKCSASGCKEGWVTTRKDNTDAVERVVCGVCKGRGKVPPFGPYGVLLREEQGILSAGGGNTRDDRDMVKFLNPDPAILEFGSKTWREYKADMEKELDLLFVEEAQSGVAKDIDREGKVAKLDLMGHHLFTVLMKRSIIILGKLLFSEVDEKALNIILPPTFTVRNEKDLTNEVKASREGQVPASIIAQLYLEFIRKRFAGNRLLVRQHETLVLYDPLYGMTVEELTTAQAGGVIDDLLVRRHELAATALQRLVRDSGEAVLDTPDIFARIDEAVEELMPASRIEDEMPVPAGEEGAPAE